MAPTQSLEEVNRLLRVSIRGRHPISAVYDGLPRKLCPHRLGWNKEGERRVHCYQFGGDSVRGLKPQGSLENWRCLAVDKLRQVALISDVWHTAANRANPQKCIVRIEMDVDDHPEDKPQNGQ